MSDADDPTRQRPPDAGGAEAQTAEWMPPGAETAHGEAVAATAAEGVHGQKADAAQQEADQAKDELEQLSKKERKAREKAEEERAKAEEERRKAEEAARRETGEAMAAAAEADATGQTVSGATVTSPGAGDIPHATPGAAPQADDKPEVAIGAAFAGAFLFAKLLKRITNR